MIPCRTRKTTLLDNVGDLSDGRDGSMVTVRTARHPQVHSRRATVALALALVLSGVATAAPAAGDGTPPTAGGWQQALPATQGLDATVLDQARQYAFAGGRNTQGVVVVRGGAIVSEWYAPGEGPRSWAASWSVAKSVASALVGIAISEGKIPSVDVPLTTYFPEWVGTPKAAITLRDVLEMQSGLQWNEDYDVADVASSDVVQMGLSRDELAYAASRPLAHPPGTYWYYSSGDAMLLSGVLERATGMPADAYARSKLFEPLGISQAEWWRDDAGHTLTYCCLDTTSRDFARIGLLYLRDGNWGGTQVVPAGWVHDSVTPAPNTGGRYGYMWWLSTLPGVEGTNFYASGFDGQWTYAIPSLDLVVVRNGDYVKSLCPPVASPNLFGRYPPSNLVPGAGTRPPGTWSLQTFLDPIARSVTGSESTSSAVPAAEGDPGTRDPDGQAMVPCADAPPVTPPVSPPVAPVLPASPTTGGPPTATPTGASVAMPAEPVAATPTYTG